MNIRQTRFLLGLVATLFCTIAFSSTVTDHAIASSSHKAVGGSMSVTQQSLMLDKNENDKVEVCKTNKSNGHMETLSIPRKTYEEQSEKNPHLYELGPCETVNSKSS